MCKQQAQKYEPILDGVRGLAVLLVMLGHFDVPGFKGGAYGVEIFFVLSGYLITRGLLKDEGKLFSIGIFYWNRFIRLMPALMFAVIGILLTGYGCGFFKQAALDSFASVSYISNWTRAIPAGVPVYLGHTWSLSIEEQFYLVWPPMLIGMARFWNRRSLLAGSLLMLLFSVLWPIYLTSRSASYARVYNGFDTRFAGLLIGCCFAILYVYLPASARGVARVLTRLQLPCLLLLLLIIARFDWTPSCAPVAWIFALSVISSCFVSGRSCLGNTLKTPALTKSGKISYSLYLWHYPIWLVLLFHFKLSQPPRAVAALVLSFIFAAVSYRLVEQPSMRLRDSATYAFRKRAGVTVLCFTLTSMISGIAYFYKEEFRNCIHPFPLTVQDYGPRRLKRELNNNEQRGRDSTVWMMVSRHAGERVHVKFDGLTLETVSQGRTITATVPVQLLSVPGTHHLCLQSETDAQIGNPLELEVY